MLLAGIQRPFTRGPKLQSRHFARVGLLGLVTASSELLYIIGLMICGPLWTILLGDFSGSTLLGYCSPYLVLSCRLVF